MELHPHLKQGVAVDSLRCTLVVSDGPKHKVPEMIRRARLSHVLRGNLLLSVKGTAVHWWAGQ